MKNKLLFLICFGFMLPALYGQVSATGNITAQGTDCTTTNACVSLTPPTGTSTTLVQLSGTFSGTVQFEVTADGTNWVASLGTVVGSTATTTTASAPGAWRFTASGSLGFRVRCSTYSSGTVAVKINASNGASGGGSGAGITGIGSQYNIPYYNSAGSSIQIIGLPGSVFNPATGFTFPAPTGTGAGLTVTGDSHSSDIFVAKMTGGSKGAWVDYLGVIHGTSVDLGVGAGSGSIELDGLTSGSTTLSVTDTGGTLNLGSTNATMTSAGALTVASCTGCGGGGSPTLNQVTDPTADKAFDMGTHSLAFNNLGDLTVSSLSTGGVVVADNTGTLSAQAPSPNYGSGLVSGGGVFCSAIALTCSVAPANYTIAGNTYASVLSTVTITANSSGNPRIDVIYVDDTGTAAVLAGTPGVNPAEPSVDVTTQLELAFVSVPDAATAPTVTNQTIYLENAGPAGEWTMTKSGSPLNLASTNNPFAGTKDIEATAAVAGNWFQGVIGSGTVDLSTFNNLTFYIRSKAAWPKNKALTIAFSSGATKVGNPVVLKSGTFAFNAAQTATYQQVTLAASSFGTGATPVDTVRFTVTGSGAAIGFYVDNIIAQSGQTSPPPVGVVPLNQVPNPTSSKTFTMGNNLLNFGLATGSTAMFGVRMDDNFNVQPFVMSVEGNVSDATQVPQVMAVSVIANNTSGTMAFAQALQVTAGVQGVSSSVTTLVAEEITVNPHSGVGTATALTIDNVSGATTNYAIQTGRGLVNFGDNMGLEDAQGNQFIGGLLSNSNQTGNETTTGSGNVGVGSSIMQSITNGLNNTGVGQVALASLTGGSSNTAVGEDALGAVIGGSQNTGVGLGALLNVTTGTLNTAIGYQANVDTGSFTNATAIGANASASASNTVQLGDFNVANVNMANALTIGDGGTVAPSVNVKFLKGATVTLYNLLCSSGVDMTVTDCGANPQNWLGVALTTTSSVSVAFEGLTLVNSSNATTIGHTVCAGATAGKVTDSGGITACVLGTQVGIVVENGGGHGSSSTKPTVLIARD